MASQRASSASTEIDWIPPAVPFDWEAAPGRPAKTVKSEIAAASALPLPPGRRPISRPVQEGRIDSPRRDRRSFHLKFPGASKKKSRKIREDSGSVFDPLSGHRFGSRIARRVLVESQKSSSCFGPGFGECLLRVDHHRGKGLDSVEESDGEEHYVTPRSSAASESPRSSPRGAGTQLQMPSSRFNMASMLLSLCPESDASDGDEVRISQHLTTPTVSDSDKVRISQHLTTPTVSDSSKVRISEHLTTPKGPVSNPSRNRKLQQASMLLSLNPESDESEESHGDEVRISQHLTTPSLADSDKVRISEHLTTPSLATVSNSGKVRISEHLTTPKGPVSNPSRNRKLQQASMLLSLNPECEESDGDEVRISEHLTTPRATVSRNRKLQQARPSSDNMVQSWSAPWSSSGSSDYSFVTSCSFDDSKAEVERGRSTSSFGTPTAEFSPLRRNPFQERLEPNQPAATRPIPSLLQISQARIHKAVRIEDEKVENNWLEKLQSSSLWPKMSAPGKGDNGDESDEAFESSSSHESFDYRTPKAVSSIPSPNSPVLNSTSPKPAIKCVVVSKKVLQSSSLLQQQQQSYESSFVLDQETTTASSPSTAFEQNNATASTDEVNSASKGENPASRLSETPNSSSGVISKAAQEESKAGVGSSGELFPIYLRRRGSTIIKAKAMSRCGDESGKDSEDSSTDSSEHGTKGAVSPTPSLNSPVFCKVQESLETETWVLSEESREELKSSSFKGKLQRQLHSMGLQTKSLHEANHNEHGTPRAVSPTLSLNAPIFFEFKYNLKRGLLVEEVLEAPSSLNIP